MYESIILSSCHPKIYGPYSIPLLISFMQVLYLEKTPKNQVINPKKINILLKAVYGIPPTSIVRPQNLTVAIYVDRQLQIFFFLLWVFEDRLKVKRNQMFQIISEIAKRRFEIANKISYTKQIIVI